MRVFVTGATGFVGSAIVHELICAGHQVLGLARSDAAAAALARWGAEAHRGDLSDTSRLAAGARACEGVIHTAVMFDPSDPVAAGETDRRAVEALGAALAESGRPFVVTSWTALLTPGRLATEEDRPDPSSIGASRMPAEEAALAMAWRGVRASVVRLPLVHGDGDRAFVPRLIGIARAKGVSAYVGDGLNRWPAVHRLDAAYLFRLALRKAPAGARLHGVADEGVPLRDIAEVIGRRLHLPVVAIAPEEAADHFGWFAPLVMLDYPASSALTRERLGWRPLQPTLLADLDQDHYFMNESRPLPATVSQDRAHRLRCPS